ncbi:TonB-dependent receptor domain-containing protein [Granulicella cerasi]|uniref:TonB-dependent receptor domain-containing protein n=1 Tax=Granulicella cerasi TaxID=741063 RepID=A0ABW1ZAQ1_9BACT
MALLFAGSLTAGRSVSAQGITSGSLSGILVDSAGLLVPNARVTLTNLDTGIVTTHQSKADGEFDFLAIPTGRYSITIEQSGFATKIISPVPVNIARQDLGKVSLSIGSSSTQVEVGATTPLLNTTESQVSETFSINQVANLPLAGGFDKLALLEPGVVQTHDGNFSNTNGAGFSSQGQRGRSNNFELDGQSNNDNSVAGPQVFFGNQDALEGIQIITNTFSAQYGRNTGSVVNYLTRQGTNKFHGALFEYWEANLLQSFNQGAKSPFLGYCAPGQSAGCTAPTLPRYVENRFGGALSGPLWKDKLFFSTGVLFDRYHQGAAPSYTTLASSGAVLFPTPTGLQQLQALYPGNPGVQALVNNGPYSIKAGNPTPLAVNTQNAVFTGPDGVTHTVQVSGIQRNVPSQSNDEEILGRLDYQMTPKDRIFLRYFYQDDPYLNGLGTGSTTALGRWYDVPDTAHSIGADITHTFNQNWVNQLRYSFQQLKVAFQGGPQPGCTISNPLGCATPVSIGGYLSLGSGSSYGTGASASMGGIGTYSSSFPQGRVVKVTQIQDNATWNKGRHNITFGGEFDYQNSPNVFLPTYIGSASFTGTSNTANPSIGLSHLLAQNGTYSLANGNVNIHFTEPDAAAYFQDDWRVSPNLTLNLGLRWEFFGQAVNLLHDQTVARESNASTAIWNAAYSLAARTFPAIPQNYKNFQPRLGFAYHPDAFGGRAVIKGGFAINYDPEFYNMFLNSATGSPVVLLSTANPCNGVCLNQGTTSAGFRAQNLPTITGSTKPNPGAYAQTTVSSNFQNPYTESWNLIAEYSPTARTVVELRYVGNHGVKLFQGQNANPNLTAAAAAFPSQVAPSQFCTTAGSVGLGRTDCTRTTVVNRGNTAGSNYHAVQAKFTSRDWHGLTTTLSYSFSKTMDNASDVFSTFEGGNTIAYSQNPLNTNYGEYARSGLDVPQVLSASFVYDFPMFKREDGIVGRLLGGFELAGLYTYDSGNTVTPYNYEYGYLYANATGQNFANYCDMTFNYGRNSGYSTCRPFLSNPKAPIGTVAIHDQDGNYYEMQDYFNNGSAVYGGTPVNPNNYHFIYNNRVEANARGTAFSNMGRNTLRATNWNNLDATLYKNFRITQQYHFQLSIEGRNILNRQYMGTPDPEIDDVSFWDTRYNSGSSRYFRVGGRFTF